MKIITKSQNRVSCNDIYMQTPHKTIKSSKAFHFLAILAFAGFIFHAPLVKGQFMTGYPGGGSAKTVSSGEEWYTDSTRAHVTHVDQMNNILHLDADIERNIRFSSWSIGDRALIIQIKVNQGSTTGYYEEVEVTGVSSNQLDVTSITRSYTDFNSNNNARVQVIKIPRYDTVYLNNCVVRCHPWDGYTGGVLCYSSGQTVINKSIITAAGCGFFPEKLDGTSLEFGKGGEGGDGDVIYTNSGGGQTATYSDYCLDPTPDMPNNFSGNVGEDGEDDGLPGDIGTTLASFIIYDYGSPNYSMNVAKLGSAGYTDSVSNSGGDGGSGGGHGGRGGTDFNSIPGSMGTVGQDGGDGGNAGRGARGGGIILIKTKNFKDSTAFQSGIFGWLDASGQQGENGRNGFGGGEQGYGGLGAIGYIDGIQVYHSGGVGGEGAPGDPSDGGDGSKGGKGGTIFLYCNPSLLGVVPTPPVFDIGSGGFNNYYDLRSGANGKGGQGGFGYNNNIPFIIAPTGIDTSQTYDHCTPPVPIDPSKYRCDCDNAMMPFSTEFETSFGVLLGSDNLEWSTGNYVSNYDMTKGRLETYDVQNDLIYICRFYSIANAEIIFRAIAANASGIPTNDYVYTRLKTQIALEAEYHIVSDNGTDSFQLLFREFDKNTGTVCIRYSSFTSVDTDIGNERRLFFEFPDTPYKSLIVDTTRCLRGHAEEDEAGLPVGSDGVDPVYPVDDVVESDHFGFTGGALLIAPFPERDPNTVNVLFTHNMDAFMVTDIEMQDGSVEVVPILKNIEVLDITGRVLYTTQTLEAKHITDVSGMASGVYIIRVTKGEEVSAYKFVRP